jgi:hypothetical protein
MRATGIWISSAAPTITNELRNTVQYRASLISLTQLSTPLNAGSRPRRQFVKPVATDMRSGTITKNVYRQNAGVRKTTAKRRAP